MNRFTRTLLRSRLSTAATYVALDGAETACRVILEDASAEIRAAGGSEVIGDVAQATISEEVGARDYGTLRVGGTYYQIQGQPEPGSVPETVILNLIRTSGAALDAFDLSPSILRSSLAQLVSIDGRDPVKAIVNQRAQMIDVDNAGLEFIAAKRTVSVSDASAFGVRSGSVVEVGARTLVVQRVLRTGSGMTLLVC